MMVSQVDHATIKELNQKLYLTRRQSPIASDMSVAAMWWASLADILEKNSTRTDFPGLSEHEVDGYRKLQKFYGNRLDEHPDYAKIMEIGSRLIAEAQTRKLHPDGHLGSLRIIRNTFAFLPDEFSLALVREHITEAEFASDTLRVDIAVPPGVPHLCAFRHAFFPDACCTLLDVRYRAGMPNSIIPKNDPWPETEQQVQAQFTEAAQILHTHATDILADEPGAFESLVRANGERDRLYVEDCERRYGKDGKGIPALPLT